MVDAFFAQARARRATGARKAGGRPGAGAAGRGVARRGRGAAGGARARSTTTSRAAASPPTTRRRAAPLNPSADQYKAMAGARARRRTPTAIAELPLATAAPHRPLPLKDGVNPAWAERIGAMRTDGRRAAARALARRADRGRLEQPSSRGWRRAAAGSRRGPTASSTALDDATTGRRCSTATAQARLDALIARDEGDRPVERAHRRSSRSCVRFRRDFVHLLNNFVSFSEFYSRRGAHLRSRHAVPRRTQLRAGGDGRRRRQARQARRPRQGLPGLLRMPARQARRSTSSRPSPPATSTSCSPAATASSTTARAATGTRRSRR